MRIFLISLAIFMFLAATLAGVGFFLLVEPGEEGRLEVLRQTSRLMLFRANLIDRLTEKETVHLYKSSCTRKCHSRDVIENSQRTAMEWDSIVRRMQSSVKAGKSADITDREAILITEYLQRNFLSNVPTILPEHVMRFLKINLWRMDFGESDLYLDVILLPPQHRSLMPYLVMERTPYRGFDTLFVIYVNTHQGTVPPWDLSGMATLRDSQGNEYHANGWKVLYEDGQKHHRQGILTFPAPSQGPSPGELAAGILEITIRLPNMRKRVFQWNLPVPPLENKP